MILNVNLQTIKNVDLDLKELSVLLYYIFKGEGVLNENICLSLWNKGYLIKLPTGYKIDNNKQHIIDDWFIKDKTPINLEELANKLRELYPNGKKLGTSYYWRDSTKVIAQRLESFFKKYGNTYTENDFIIATQKYINSFNGDYRYMQLLKYFIFKKVNNNGEIEENSQLLSYMSNEDEDDDFGTSWLNELK